MAASTNTLPNDLKVLKALVEKERAQHKREVTSIQQDHNNEVTSIRQDHDKEVTSIRLKLNKEILSIRQQLNTVIEALHIERQRLYGSKSEKSPGQGELFDEAEITVEEIDDETPANTPEKTPKKRATRKPLPADLPRVRKVQTLSDAELLCACGCTLSEIGEQTSEQLDIIPAKVQVIEHVRKKYACKSCEETIKLAPRPPVLLPKSIASGDTMAFVITSKYADGLPLYRLSEILKRYHIDISRQTLSDSVLRCADQLAPLMERLRDHLMQSSVLYMDETPVQVLNEPDKSPQSKSYMWVQRGGPPDKCAVCFTYDPSRATDVPNRLLLGYRGVLMTDGYQPYRTVAAEKHLVHLCCWAHARRKFKDAQRVQPKGKTGKADVAINLIAKLYAVETQTASSDAATRHRTRQERSVPVLEKLQAWLIKTSLQVPPSSAIGKAVSYTLKYWAELSRYTKKAEWPIDNNCAENAIRPFAIGRKAWLFSNSQRGAIASACLYSLIETAKANQQEPYQYLSWLFEQLPITPAEKLETLLPWNKPVTS